MCNSRVERHVKRQVYNLTVPVSGSALCDLQPVLVRYLTQRENKFKEVTDQEGGGRGGVNLDTTECPWGSTHASRVNNASKRLLTCAIKRTICTITFI